MCCIFESSGASPLTPHRGDGETAVFFGGGEGGRVSCLVTDEASNPPKQDGGFRAPVGSAGEGHDLTAAKAFGGQTCLRARQTAAPASSSLR